MSTSIQGIATSLGALSARDRQIIELAMRSAGATPSFTELARALREAVAQIIPAGRVFYLGQTAHSPILGSLISGVGIVETERGITWVRVR